VLVKNLLTPKGDSMSVFPFQNSNYGFPSPLTSPVLPPIISLRTPKTNDFAPIGSLWIYTTGNAAYILVSIVSNVATWNLLEASSGAGVFSSLTVTPGPVSLTGTTTINTSGAANTNIGSGTNTGTVTIGSTAHSTAVDIFAPTVDIDSSTGGGVTVGDSITTGSVSMATSLTTGGLVLGSNAGTAATTLIYGGSGTGGIVLQGGTGSTSSVGNVQIVPGTATSASPSASATLNQRVGVVTFTGFTTASAGDQAYTIVNSKILTTSFVMVSVANLNTSGNGAEIGVFSVTQAAGSIIVNTSNAGAGALGAGDNVLISFVINS
jgi:hypothetical protein